MRRRLLTFLAIAGSVLACVPSKPPVTPTPPAPRVSVDFQLYCGGAPAIDREVFFDQSAGNQSGRSNNDGWIRFVVPATLRTATLRVNDKATCFRVDVALTLPGLDSQPAIVVTLPVKPPPFVSAGERQKVHVDANRFAREDGSTFQWRGSTDFQLFREYLHGDSLGTLLDQRARAGTNVLRVLGSFDWTPFGGEKLIIQSEGQYYAKLASFLSLLKDRGFCVEFTAWGDGAQLTTRDEQQAHITKIADVLAAAPGCVFLEVANEPDGDKNIVGGGDRADALGASVRGRGFPIANGDYRLPDHATSWHALDYVTVHTDRGPEWMRKSKELQDWKNGFHWNPSNENPFDADFPGLHRPIIGDEPTGAGEFRDGDSRSDDAEEFAQYGGICALFGAGCTLHSEAGASGDLWGPKQQAAAEAFYWAMKWVPLDAVNAPYQAGRGEGGAGIGDMPAEHIGDYTGGPTPTFRPEGALRMFCKVAGGFEWCIAAKPGPTFKWVPRRGCTVVDEPRRGFAKLACPQPEDLYNLHIDPRSRVR